MNNLSLKKAKVEKNDEFYTQLNDVSKELIHYKQHFKNKIVYCNCDNPIQSAFWEYFHLNFEELELKELISTHYDNNQSTYKMVYIGKNDSNIQIGIKTNLQNNGDFRSQECLDILDKSDIIVTNPPFSLFREYIMCLIEHNKKFLIIAPLNAVKYKEIFPLIKDNKIWTGNGFQGGNAYFSIPPNVDTSIYAKGVYDETTRLVKFRNCIWLTNMDLEKRHKELILQKKYSSNDFPTYDNYDAIECSKVANIPYDTNKIIGVPITFLTQYNPNQFEIIGKLSNGVINGKKVYERILIRKK